MEMKPVFLKYFMQERKLTLSAVSRPSRWFERHTCTGTKGEKPVRHKKMYTCILDTA